jgi:uncharacterized surface protein with fasciclin (FAS1) repeats
MTLRKTHTLALASMISLALGAALAAPAFAQMGAMDSMSMRDPMVGGAAMYTTKNIIENAVNSKDHTTLVAAVKAADLVDTLEGPGPFTVFAPTNEAFDKLPPGTVTTLLQPENKAKLAKILTYHVVSGRYTAADLMKMVKDGGGAATLTTVEGEPLTITQTGHVLLIHDVKGDVAHVTIGDVIQSNGVIHVVDTVLLPN